MRSSCRRCWLWGERSLPCRCLPAPACTRPPACPTQQLLPGSVTRSSAQPALHPACPHARPKPRICCPAPVPARPRLRWASDKELSWLLASPCAAQLTRLDIQGELRSVGATGSPACSPRDRVSSPPALDQLTRLSSLRSLGLGSQDAQHFHWWRVSSVSMLAPLTGEGPGARPRGRAGAFEAGPAPRPLPPPPCPAPALEPCPALLQGAGTACPYCRSQQGGRAAPGQRHSHSPPCSLIMHHRQPPRHTVVHLCSPTHPHPHPPVQACATCASTPSPPTWPA